MFYLVKNIVVFRLIFYSCSVSNEDIIIYIAFGARCSDITIPPLHIIESLRATSSK